MKSLVRPLWEVYLVTTPQAQETAAALLSQTLRRPVSSVTDLRTGRVRVAGYLSRPPARGWQQLHRSFRQQLNVLAPALSHVNRTSADTSQHTSPSSRIGLGLTRRARRAKGAKHGQTQDTISPVGPLRTRRLPARRWAEAWKAHFQPFTIGSALLIRPSWSHRRPRRGMRLIEIDPGLSFGTGQHPTTRFCLDQLLNCRQPGHRQSCLDLGTGSGLLAIAAAKLGYQKVLAVDIDPVSVTVARRNARRNRVSNRLRIRRGDVRALSFRPASAYDVVCANLLTELLLQQRKRIAAAVRRGGVLILAGILRDEMPAVIEAYQSVGFRLVRSRCQREWRSGCFRRHQS